MKHSIFKDDENTRAWFDHLDTIPDEEADRIQIPDLDTWKAWLEYVEVPEEDLPLVIDSSPAPDSDLYQILQKGAASLLQKMGNLNGPPRFAALKNENDPTYRYFYVQLLTASLPFLREYHQRLMIPEDITQATVADLGRNVRVHRKREGVGGLGVMWWLMLHFRGMIYQLGRLQFEMQTVGEQIAQSMQANGRPANADTHALSIHIPDFMGPMGYDACTESIRQAADFFPTHFPDWPVRVAFCDSWLLDPQLKEFLRPDSNIIRFQDRFTLAGGETWDATESVLQFVFGRKLADLDSLQPVSSLERGIVNHIRAGRTFSARRGWFLLPH